MAGAGEEQQESPFQKATATVDGNEAQNMENPLPTLSVWPPGQRAREAVIKRLVETLSDPPDLLKRYGAVPGEEASAAASRIEEEAFAFATASSAAPASDGAEGESDSAGVEGMDTLHIYSKEVSKRMLDFLKARPPIPSPPSASRIENPPLSSAEATAASGEASSLESETS